MEPKDSALVPLGLVRKYTEKYPEIWKLAKTLREIPNADWDTHLVYLPIGAGIAIMRYLHMPQSGLYMIPALAAWREHKEVYNFDQDLEAELYSQADDLKIPSEVLKHLPFFCVYINAKKYHFFAHLEHDTRDGHYEMRFVRILDDGQTSASYLHLGDFTISEAIAAGVDDSERTLERMKTDTDLQRDFWSAAATTPENEYSDSFDVQTLAEMLQLVLYICADNADIQQQVENKRTYRKRESGEIKDKFREVRKWDTGFYVGNSIRKNRSCQGGEKQPYQGVTKCPHMRRGHWHHFWKGSQGERELVLHWVLPIFVNGENSDGDSPARITPIKP